MGQIKVDIKVSADLTYTFIEEDNLIEGFGLSRKMDSNISALCGEIECGEVNLTLSNLFNEFNILSTAAVYSQIKNGQELKIYSITDAGTYTLFTGYIVDFIAPTSTDTQSCNVRAVDRLHALLNTDITVKTELQVEKGLTLSAYFSKLFGAYGLTAEDYELDTDLEQIILDYALVVGKSLSEQLNEVCKAVDCYIYVNRVGRIIVKAKTITGTAVKTYTRDDGSLISSEYGYSLFSSCNALKVGYVAAMVSEVKSILVVDSQSVQPGDNIFDNFELGISNLYELDSIRVTSQSDTVLTSLSATASTISFVLNNPTDAEDIVSIEVYGKTVETADAFVVKSVDTEQTEQSIEVKSLLVQQREYAEKLAEKLYVRASQPIPYITAEVEVVDFAVDLGYIVSVVDSEADFTYTGYIHSIDIEYDGQGYAFYTLGIRALYEEVVDNGAD